MTTEAASSGHASAAMTGAKPAPLSHAEFASRLAGASKTLWLIAAAVLGRRGDAEDVVQESAVIGLQKINEFDPRTNFAAWMGGIVRNVARNAARKSVRRHTESVSSGDLDQSRQSRPGAAPEASFDRRGRLPAGQSDFDDRTIAALATLDETARVCLLLRTLRDLPYKEIAAMLSIPEGTAMSHVHRARAAMRQQLMASTGPARKGGKDA